MSLNAGTGHWMDLGKTLKRVPECQVPTGFKSNLLNKTLEHIVDDLMATKEHGITMQSDHLKYFASSWCKVRSKELWRCKELLWSKLEVHEALEVQR
jgi:hypothetical protein